MDKRLDRLGRLEALRREKNRALLRMRRHLQCASCGHDLHPKQEDRAQRCPKCGASALELVPCDEPAWHETLPI